MNGNALPNSPEHSVQLGLAYSWFLSPGTLTLRWDYYWQDKSYSRPFNTKGDEIEALDQHNASLTFESADNRWSVRAWVRNLTDENVVTGHTFVRGSRIAAVYLQLRQQTSISAIRVLLPVGFTLLGFPERIGASKSRCKQRERLDDVQAMLAQRSLSHHWGEDGMLVVHGRLSPEQGAIWLKAMEKAEREAATDLNAHEAEQDDDDYRARQADAITRILEDGLSGRESSTGDRYQVTVHVSAAETLCETQCGSGRGSESSNTKGNPTDVPTIDNGPHLHPETVKRLTCDGALVSVLENRAGEVLNVGRKTRVIHASTRRALKARDGHCQYPGCSQSRYVDGHHLVHWADGGETKLQNLVLLCRRHHRLVHEFGYVVHNTASGFEFVHPR